MAKNKNTTAFFNMAWISFILSSVGTLIGIIYMQSTIETKGFFAMAYLFSLSSCFTLAKVLRDRHEDEV